MFVVTSPMDHDDLPLGSRFNDELYFRSFVDFLLG